MPKKIAGMRGGGAMSILLEGHLAYNYKRGCHGITWSIGALQVLPRRYNDNQKGRVQFNTQNGSGGGVISVIELGAHWQ